jgi:adenosylmethionine-8-amino-7-oxononanoate aminotransferase
VFMHGPTFMGNPLACAAAVASLICSRASRGASASRGSRRSSRRPRARASLRGVADVRVLGAIGVVELELPVDMAVVQPAFVDAGVWIRRSGSSSTRCRPTSRRRRRSRGSRARSAR